MELNQTESVTQPVVSGTTTETSKENLSKADLDYKRDMLKFKDENALLKEKLEEIALSEKQRKGDLEGVIGSLKDEIKKLKHENASSKLSYAETQLNNAIKSELVNRGLKDKSLDAFMKLVDEEDKSIIELDSKFNVNNDDIKTLVDKNMDRYGDLFKKEVKIADATPSNKNNFSPKQVDLSKMSASQLKEYIKNNATNLS